LLLTVPSISSAVSNEMFRLTPPSLLGGQDRGRTLVKLPGAKAPSLELINNPGAVKPLRDLVAEASALGAEFMRTGAPSGAAVVAPISEGIPAFALKDRPPPSAAETKLAGLLKRQQQLANDATEAGERAYQDCIAEIVQAQAEVDAQNGAIA
jgi:hypothetical protein